MTTSAARKILLPFLSCIDKRTKKGYDRDSKDGTVHIGRCRKGTVSL